MNEELQVGINYKIDENGHLILTSIYGGLEVGSVDGGNIEDILYKAKMYDEEYHNLINQNNLMKEIYKDYETKDKENQRLNNIIEELEWKPIEEYFKNKENYDWVLVKYYDKYNFECIPSVAEYRFGKWYLKDNEKTLQDFEVRYFMDMQQIDKLKELKEGK